VTPTGHERPEFPGSWLIKIIESAKTKAPWRPVHSVHQVVEMICAASQY